MSSIGSNINSINASLLSEIQSLSATKSASKSARTAQPAATADRVDFSKVGELFGKLEQLQKSDPEGLKQVLTDAASKLKEAASKQTDPTAASFLNDLAGRFEKAADSGDLKSLHPEVSSDASGPSGHHGHQHHVQRADHDSDDQATSTNSKPAPRLLGPPISLPPAPPEENKDNPATTAEPTQPSREERFQPAPEPTTESFVASTRDERSQTSNPAPSEPATPSPETVQLLGPPEPAPYLADRYAFHEVRKADNYSEDGGSSTPTSSTRSDPFVPPPEPSTESFLASNREARSQISNPANTLASILTSNAEETGSGRIGRLLLQFVSSTSSEA